jgi:hypothetical protein
MKQAIAGLQDGAAAPEARLAALEELQRLVEPIDNANGGMQRNRMSWGDYDYVGG